MIPVPSTPLILSVAFPVIRRSEVLYHSSVPFNVGSIETAGASAPSPNFGATVSTVTVREIWFVLFATSVATIVNTYVPSGR